MVVTAARCSILPRLAQPFSLLKLFTPCLLAAVAAGCSEIPASIPQSSRANENVTAQERPLPANAAIEQANAYLASGQKRDAASAYFEAADQFGSPDRERLILQAAELAASFRDSGLTRRYLAPIETTPLNSENEARYRLIQGQLALNDRNYTTALRLMPHRVAELPEALGEKILDARRYAAKASGNKLVLVQELVLQEPNLLSEHQVELNHNRIWGHLKQMPVAQLNQGRREMSHPDVRGWLELAYLTRLDNVTADKQTAQIAQWKDRFPSHPGHERLNELFGNRSVASTTPYREDDSASLAKKPGETASPATEPTLKPADEPTAEVTTTGAPAGRFTVLLPLAGQHGAIGKAILAGIQAAAREQGAAGSGEIQAIDTSTTDIKKLHSNAASTGARMIIGPFDKKRLEQLAQSDLSVPTLGLNYLGSGKTTRNLYQFGLLPEDEAIQIAQHAINRGEKRLAVLTPDSSWGKRLAKTLESAIRSRGGEIAFKKSYASSTNNLGYIRSLIETQKESLDAMLLIASPSQARDIYPALREAAPELPVYATTHVYNGLPDTKNASLNGLKFTEVPWVLKSSSTQAVSRYPRLYAMGRDAYAIAQRLDQLKNNSAVYQGDTGRIRMSADGSLHRTLQMATFKQGNVVAD